MTSLTEFDGKIYVFMFDWEFGFYSYDPTLDEWTEKRSIDKQITLFKAKGQIYAFEHDGTVHLYDTKIDAWQKV